jgi:hypothetical protein
LNNFGFAELNVFERTMERDFIDCEGDDVGVILFEVLPVYGIGFIVCVWIVIWI